jgi:pSer/pThr/pTyr-binding forkhead associated (FHA) protein
MNRDNDAGGEGGTVLEPIPPSARPGSATAATAGQDGTRLESLPANQVTPARGPAPTEAAYRAQIRPLVPRLVMLDDGEQAAGETVWLREPATVIGRSEGEIRLPHDPLVSGRHAEIIREGAARPHRWLLRDLGSANGTFVRCARTPLRQDAIIILGSRRFRFRPPQAKPAAGTFASGTVLADVAALPSSGWPALVETTQARPPVEIMLAGVDLSVGRPGQGNAIEIDDPLLAATHARILRQPSGQWMLEALPSLNGVWVQVQGIVLAPVSRFQIGEQRFLFLLVE